MAGLDNLEFAWAKACALVSPSLEEEYTRNSCRYQDLETLGALLAPGQRPPEGTGISGWLEDHVTRRFSGTCLKVLGAFPEPPPLLALVLGHRDLVLLKGALAASAGGPLSPARHLSQVFARSVFRGLGPVTAGNLAETYLELDSRYQAGLRDAARDFDGDEVVSDELAWEASAEEALTALRLRFVFGWDLGRARGTYIRKAGASEVFSLPADRREPWDDWAFGALLEPEPGTPWAPDPVVFETNLRRQTGIRGRRMFRSLPLSLDGLFGFFRWQEAEADLWRTRIEALS